MATKKPETEVKQAFARASRRIPMTIEPLAPATRTRRQAARTLWTASQLLESYRDPREVLLEIAGTDTATLAEQMGCTLLEALQERRLCAQAVLPFVAQKLPVQVDLRHTRAVHLHFLDQDQYSNVERIANGGSTDADTIEGEVVAPRTQASACERGLGKGVFPTASGPLSTGDDDESTRH